MFIYSKFSTHGVEKPEKLVHLLANEGVRAICLIDEFGLGLPSFLHTCKKRNVQVSFAIPFVNFIEGETQKKEGYWIVASYDDYCMVRQYIKQLAQDFIPLVTKAHIEQWATKGVYCLIENGSDYQEYCSKTRLPIVPFAYENDWQKAQAVQVVGGTLEESFHAPETVIFVEGVSQSATCFLNAFQADEKMVDLTSYRLQNGQLTCK